MFLTHVSPASPLDVCGGFTTRYLWWLNQDDKNQVDRGADNPHRNIPNFRHSPTLECGAINDDDDDDDF
jgi:hypothetical protein